MKNENEIRLDLLEYSPPKREVSNYFQSLYSKKTHNRDERFDTQFIEPFTSCG